MKRYCFGILIFVLASCQYFETEKVSSDEFFEEDIATINWNDVDQYPTFSMCEEDIDKEAQLGCFQEVIVRSIAAQLSDEDRVSTRNITDTVHLHLKIDNTGKISLKEMEIDSLLQRELPHIWAKIDAGIKQLPEISPAVKRGIPVNTEFVLPVIIRTKEL